tara:strand:- start:26 stop:961 length:936 start_codon:yes stop_codon:yes gene_type:complete
VKIGFIGSSAISRFHIDALKNNNFEIEAIGTRFLSSNCKKFAESLNLLDKFCDGGWEEVLKKDVDAFCLCINTKETPKILREILKVGKSVFVEKPVSLYFEDFDYFINHPMKDNIFVGYNRRFYKTINIAKKRCENSPQGGTIVVNIPDSNSGKKQFLNNGCHMIDSLRYIVGDFEVCNSILRMETNGLDFSSISALCKTKNWSILINAHSKISSNFSITINIDDMVYELKPLEKLNVYQGIKISEPTFDEPIRRYNPMLKESIIESSIFKPGFNEMYKNFSEYIYNKNSNFCNISDARETIKTCLDLIKE